jgi:hypothetical protein
MKLEKGYTSQQLTAFWIQVRRDGLKARRTMDGGWETYGEDAPEDTQQFAPVSFVRETGVKMDSHITASRSCGDEITYISNEENGPETGTSDSVPKDLKDFKDLKVLSETDLSESAESPVEKPEDIPATTLEEIFRETHSFPLTPGEKWDGETIVDKPAKRGFWKRLKSVIQNSKFKIQNSKSEQ